MTDSNKKTPLYDVHVDLRAKIVDYHDFLMPLQYSSIISEHKCVRSNAGLFDISHMGEIVIVGKGATELVQKIITNDVSNLPDYKAHTLLFAMKKEALLTILSFLNTTLINICS